MAIYPRKSTLQSVTITHKDNNKGMITVDTKYCPGTSNERDMTLLKHQCKRAGYWKDLNVGDKVLLAFVIEWTRRTNDSSAQWLLINEKTPLFSDQQLIDKGLI